jgi:hypothetical protein
MDEKLLWRKLTLRAGGRRIVLVKKPVESGSHVLMKALLWGLYLPAYPDAMVEYSIGDRYKPDVVALDPTGEPIFWGEAGKVGVEKIRSLVRRYRGTHFALGKWDARLDPYESIVREALADVARTAPFDLIRFPADSAERFIDGKGEIRISHHDISWLRIGEGG